MWSNEIKEKLTKRGLRVISNEDKIKECATNKTTIDYVIEHVTKCKLSNRLLAIANHTRAFKKIKLLHNSLDSIGAL